MIDGQRVAASTDPEVTPKARRRSLTVAYKKFPDKPGGITRQTRLTEKDYRRHLKQHLFKKHRLLRLT
jgi:hypothetical protein